QRMVDGGIGAVSTTSLAASKACFGALTRIACAAAIARSPDLMNASALPNKARSPDASSGSMIASPCRSPRRSSPARRKVTSLIVPPDPGLMPCFGRYCARLAAGRQQPGPDRQCRATPARSRVRSSTPAARGSGVRGPALEISKRMLNPTQLEFVQPGRVVDQNFLTYGSVRRPGGQEIEHQPVVDLPQRCHL